MLRKNYAPGHRGDVFCYGLWPISLKVVVNKTCDEFTAWVRFNTSLSRPRQNDLRFQDEIFKSIFSNKNCCILMKISLKFVPQYRVQLKYSSIGSDGGWVLVRRQEIIRVNDGLI